MKLWADECVTPELEEVAHARGYQGTSNRQRAMLNILDSELYSVVTGEDWVLITNNEVDFRKLARRERLHSGLIVLPQHRANVQRAWLEAVIDFIEAEAHGARESPADWMMCRIVTYEDDSIDWEWWPEDPGA